MKTEIVLIGDLASRIGVQPEAIRYYERRGLLPPPKRGANRYRIYTPQHVERVEFIKKAQTLGFSLEEIRQVMELRFAGTSPCQHVRDLLREKLGDVDRQIERLKLFRRELADSLKRCEESLERHTATVDSCPVVERLRLGSPSRSKR